MKSQTEIFLEKIIQEFSTDTMDLNHPKFEEYPFYNESGFAEIIKNLKKINPKPTDALLVITIIYFLDDKPVPQSSSDTKGISKSGFLLLIFILPSLLFVLPRYDNWTTNPQLYFILIIAIVCACLIFIRL